MGIRGSWECEKGHELMNYLLIMESHSILFPDSLLPFFVSTASQAHAQATSTVTQTFVLGQSFWNKKSHDCIKGDRLDYAGASRLCPHWLRPFCGLNRSETAQNALRGRLHYSALHSATFHLDLIGLWSEGGFP